MSVFSTVSALRPKRNVFNLSYEKKYNCDIGQLIPVFLEDCVPGDKFKISYEAVVRMNPLIAPVLHQIDLKVEYFFVPYRLMMETDKFSDFISGGVNGSSTVVLPRIKFGGTLASPGAKWQNRHLSLYDYFGFPCEIFPTDENGSNGLPFSRFPFSAYRMIWNEYYRDENIQTKAFIDLSANVNFFGSATSTYDTQYTNEVFYRCWKKDYFTSALPFRQRGTTPSFPLVGEVPVVFGEYASSDLESLGDADKSTVFHQTASGKTFHSNGISFTRHGSYSSEYGAFQGDRLALGIGTQSASLMVSPLRYLNADLSSANSGFDVSDLRLSFQIQKFLERNARSGVRYPEFLMAHFGVSPSDARLQRPEYLGGSSSPIMVSEVLQTSQTTSGTGGSPQGNLAGRGLGAASDYIATYTVPEFGLIMGIASICPKLAYSSQGFNKKWLKISRYDFYFPEFAHLSEEPVQKQELYVSNSNAANISTFGFQGIYDNMRHNRSEVVGDLRGLSSDGYSDLSYWHLNRRFASQPSLNSDFISMKGTSDSLKRIFAVQNEPGFIVDFGNIVKAIRPLPKFAEPGLIDHF